MTRWSQQGPMENELSTSMTESELQLPILHDTSRGTICRPAVTVIERDYKLSDKKLWP
jgi:hypothetical protein